MCNLIHANMKRIWKTRVFQISAIIVAGLALFQVLMNYRDYVVCGGTPYFDNALFAIAAVAVFPLAAFASLYIGTEYSDGTLRNKIVIGQGRTAIYIANLVVTMIVGWMFVLIWTVAYLVPGLILMESGNPPVVYLLVYAGIFCELAVFSAIFTWISMVLGKKAGSSVACIFLTLLFFLSGTVIQSTLDQDEYYSPEYTVTESGEIEYSGELEPNPNYLPEGSRERAVYEFLLIFTPGGQIMQLCAIRLDRIGSMMLYDLGWFAVMTGAGVLMFRRKSLK